MRRLGATLENLNNKIINRIAVLVSREIEMFDESMVSIEVLEIFNDFGLLTKKGKSTLNVITDRVCKK